MGFKLVDPDLVKETTTTPRFNIHNGDVIKWASDYKGAKFHGLITDPPYHLTSIVKRFGSPTAKAAKEGTDGVFVRSSKGFMGKTWDGGDIAFQLETWFALGQHLHPGAFGMAFASSRGWHRLAVAIEDAGFIIHPSIFGWLYGSGFPKATRIDTAIDKKLGLEREVIGYEKGTSTILKPGMGVSGLRQVGSPAGEYKSDERIKLPLTTPASPLAKTWEPYRYGLQALKPALEPIIVFQKPYEGKSIDNITKTGAGALNIMGAKIGIDVHTNQGGLGRNITTNDDNWKGIGSDLEKHEVEGRWPSNFVVDSELAEGLGESGRFFFNVESALDETDPIYYCSKASTTEREAGLEGFDQTTVNDGRETPIDNPYQRGETVRKNTHPTVKPLKLNQHLATLLLPPAEYSPRRLLIPFSGAGSEVIGSLLSGWDFVQGIELEAEYVKLAEARIKYYLEKSE